MSSTPNDNSGIRTEIALLAVAAIVSGILLLGAFGTSSHNEKPNPRTHEADNPAALDTPTLLASPRTAAVCSEILKRMSVPRPVLQDCLLFLARSHRTTDLRTLLMLVNRLEDDETSTVELSNLCLLYVEMSAEKIRQTQEGDVGYLAAGLIARIAEIPRDQRISTTAQVAFALAERLRRQMPIDKRARFDERLSELAP